MIATDRLPLHKALSHETLLSAGLPPELLFDGSDLERYVWTQLLLDHGGEFFPQIQTTVPVAEKTESNYRSSIGLFERWCAERSVADVAALDVARRAKLVEGWLAVRAKVISDGQLKVDRRALVWWAKQNRFPNPVSDVSRALRSTVAGTGQAKPLTVSDYNMVLRALDTGAVVKPSRPAWEMMYQAWHLRQKAVITFTVACSLRAVSELPSITDDCVVGVDDTGVSLKLPKSKYKSQPQDIRLLYRDDLGCPVTALYNWLAFCDENRLARHGVLLPAVYRHRHGEGATARSQSRASETNQWKLVANYVGLDRRATMHGLRATMPTAAAAAGWGLHRIRNLGRWVDLGSAATYVRATPAPLGLLDDLGEVT